MTSRSYTFVLPNTDPLESSEYTLRGLVESEILEWTRFCASVFAKKSPPPPAEYFLRHYVNDSSRNPSDVRVACCKGKMVASCRIFRRKISVPLDGEPLEVTPLTVGGLGEVCTDIAHRRRGLSKALTKDCLDTLRRERVECSLLHAAPAFIPVYQASGFHTTRAAWSRLPIQAMTIQAAELKSSSGADYRIRNPIFPQDTAALKRLYHQTTQQRVATIARSDQYWETYLGPELGKSWCVLTNRDDQIMGALALRKRGEVVSVADCSWDAQLTTAELCMSCLLPACLAAIGNSSSSEDITFKLPTFLLQELSESSFATGDAVPDDDAGWMIQSLCENATIPAEVLIWPSDSF